VINKVRFRKTKLSVCGGKGRSCSVVVRIENPSFITFNRGLFVQSVGKEGKCKINELQSFFNNYSSSQGGETMTKRVVAIYSVLVVVITLLAVFVPSCGGGGGGEVTMPTFVAHFMTPEGEPYPFDDFIISNGTWRKEFNNVTAIETEVPCNATYTFVYRREGWEFYRNFNILLSPGEVREFEFYALNVSQIEFRSTPYLFFQEVGANASLSWEWNPDTGNLTWTLSAEHGKYVDLMVGIDDNISGPPNYVVKRVNPDIPPRQLSYHSPASCWINSILNPSMWDPPPAESVVTGYCIFGEINSNLGTIRVGYGLYKDSIVVYPINTTLSLNGTIVEKAFVDPQYAVPPGSYILSTDNIPGGYVSLKYPINVKAGKGTEIDNFYPPKITELSYFTFLAAAESAYSHSSSSNLTHDTGTNTLSVAVSTETNYDWWGCFVLPNTATMTGASSSAGNSVGILIEGRDYTINPVGNYNLVCVRIEPEWERIALKYSVTPAA
jgi:hypothetical protein